MLKGLLGSCRMFTAPWRVHPRNAMPINVSARCYTIPGVGTLVPLGRAEFPPLLLVDAATLSEMALGERAVLTSHAVGKLACRLDSTSRPRLDQHSCCTLRRRAPLSTPQLSSSSLECRQPPGKPSCLARVLPFQHHLTSSSWSQLCSPFPSLRELWLRASLSPTLIVCLFFRCCPSF